MPAAPYGSRLLRVGSVVVAIVLFAAPVRAVDGPGLGNLTYGAHEHFREVGRIESPHGHGNAAMLNGYLLVIYSSDSGGTARDGGIEFWDVSNPREPRLAVRHDDADTHRLREPHGFAFSRVRGRDVMAAQSLDGVHFWDLTDPRSISLVASVDLPGIGPGDYSGAWWVFWQAPYVYVAGVGQGLYVVDATDLDEPVLLHRVPSGAMGGVNPSLVYAIGNLLVVTSAKDGHYATLDVGDPSRPSLVHSISSGRPGYSHLFAAGKILTSGGDGGRATMGVHDVSSRGRITFAGGGPLFCGFLRFFGNGGYGSYQDGSFFSGFSNRVAKFDVKTLRVVDCSGAHIVSKHDDLDFAQVLGNVLWVGNDHGQGSPLVPHQVDPDFTPPVVEWLHPPPGSGDQPLTGRVGVSMSDAIDLDSVGPGTFSVSPVGGATLPGAYSVQMGLVNFSPEAPFEPGRTYEVVVRDLQDLVGNVAPEYRATFSTGSFGRPVCELVTPLPPLEVNELGTFTPQADTAEGTKEYVWDFGDGISNPPSRFASATHAWSEPGRYAVSLTVHGDTGSSSCSAVQIVHNPMTPVAPTASSSITHHGRRVYVVNPDNDTVTAIDDETLTKAWEARTGDDPRSLAVGPRGDLWVVSRGDATIRVLETTRGDVLDEIQLPRGSEPYGLAFSPDGSAAWVTLGSLGRLMRLDAVSRTVTAETSVGPHPRGIAVGADSRRVLVTRFLSPAIRFTDPDDATTLQLPNGEVREIDAATLRVVRRHPLRFDAGPDTEAGGRGVPNYVSAVCVSPDGLRALVPSKKDNVARGEFVDGQPLTFEARVRTIVSEIDLTNRKESARVDLDDRDLARAVLFSARGDLVFVAAQGSNLVEVRNANQLGSIVTVLSTGRAPIGLARNAECTRLYIHNFLSRSVSIFDVDDLVSGASNAVTLLAEVGTVARETLSPEVLHGKRIFFDASDPRMSQDGYLSCASCHLDGGGDGQIWDLTQSGEGLRNTIDLLGRGRGHGNVHWTANFDEIQDFEGDIRQAFAGKGFLSDEHWRETRDPLGRPKAGRSADLDALAAYVTSLDRLPESPHRDARGELTARGRLGREVFVSRGCSDCHGDRSFTDRRLHDVGTVERNSGRGRGHSLAGVGIETPTLKGLWRTAPYLHNGQAATLAQVLDNPVHVGPLDPSEKEALIAYLLQIDDRERAPASRIVARARAPTVRIGAREEPPLSGHSRELRHGSHPASGIMTSTPVRLQVTAGNVRD